MPALGGERWVWFGLICEVVPGFLIIFGLIFGVGVVVLEVGAVRGVVMCKGGGAMAPPKF